MWTLYEGDNMEIMPALPSKSVNLIATDPPYNIGKAEWDKIPNYVEWLGARLKECERLLKDNGSLYFFHNDMEQIAKLMVWVKRNTSFVFKQMIVWNKRFDGARNKGFLDGFVETGGLRNYQQMAEYCLYYTTSKFNAPDRGARIGEKDMYSDLKEYFRREKELCEREEVDINEFVPHTSNFHYFANGSSFNLPSKSNYEKLQKTGRFPKPYSELKRAYGEYQNEYEALRTAYDEKRYTFDNQKTHHSVWEYEIAPKIGHLTPKPVDLMENIIMHSSNPGDLILDPFAGSGTTAEAAERCGRNSILIELEPNYCTIIRERLSNLQIQQAIL